MDGITELVLAGSIIDVEREGFLITVGPILLGSLRL